MPCQGSVHRERKPQNWNSRKASGSRIREFKRVTTGRFSGPAKIGVLVKVEANNVNNGKDGDSGMNRTNRQATKWSSGRRALSTLSVERLEDRTLMAGDVAVYFSRGALVIQGDDASNDILIRAQTGGGFIVEGRNQTTINRGTAGFRVSGQSIGGNLVAQMRGGNDIVGLEDVRGTALIYLEGGSGADQFLLTRVNSPSLQVVGNSGDDAVQLTTVNTTGNGKLLLGKGNDTIAAPSWTVGGRMSVDTSKGDDTMVFGSLTVTGSVGIQSGKGNDNVAFINATRLPANTYIGTSRGNDSVLFNPSRGTGTATFAGSIRIDTNKGDDTIALDSSTTLPSSIFVQGGRGTDRLSDASTTTNVNKNISSIEDRSSANITTLVDAALTAMERSGFNRSLFANPASPTVTLGTAAITFQENGSARLIDGSLTITDTDSTNLTGATISFVSGFSSGTGNDVLDVTTSNGITKSFNATTGTLTRSGNTTVANYQAVLRTLTFRNTSENPSTTPRVIRVSVTDGTTSGQADRTINVTAVDDVGAIQIPTEFTGQTVATRPAGAAFTVDVNINEPDTTGYVFQLDLEGSGIPANVAQPTINSSTGVITWTPPASLVGTTVTLRVIAIASNAAVNQESFQVRIVAAS